MNEQKPIIVPEEIECSSGSVFSFNYKTGCIFANYAT